MKRTCKLIIFFLVILNFLSIKSLVKSKPALCISIPKSGTHLIEKCFDLIGLKKKLINDISELKNRNYKNDKGCFYYGRGTNHLIYNEVNKIKISNGNIVKFLMIRDPRDQVVSHAYYIKRLPKVYPQFIGWSIEEIIIYLIDSASCQRASKEGIPSYSLESFFIDEYLNWAQDQSFLVLRFENLVGLKGGGCDKLQQHEIKKIVNHLGLNLSNEKIEHIADSIFGGSVTFRKGLIGSWKEEFTQDHIRLWKKNKKLCHLLIDLGYEKNVLW